MNSPRAVSVLMSSDLLTLSRACAVLRRRNMPVRGFAVASQGVPGVWRLTCEIDADDAAAENLTLLIENVIGVRKASITPCAPAISPASPPRPSSSASPGSSGPGPRSRPGTR